MSSPVAVADRSEAELSRQATCEVTQLSHAYGDAVAVDGVDLEVRPGEIVAVLGRNGSGKTTLFRVLSTLIPAQRGSVRVAGIDVRENPMAARAKLGIIFQSPSLDIKLTVLENMRCQGALYGLTGVSLKRRCDKLLECFDLTDRRDEFCQTLSGGLKRRVELAKGLLHQPELMLLDEPSTGLDPSARLSLWATLEQLACDGVAVMLTTHLMDEAAKASRVVLLDRGRKIADAKPAELQSRVGQQVLTIVADEAEAALAALRHRFGLDFQRVGDSLRLTSDAGGGSDTEGAIDLPALVAPITDALGSTIRSITLGRASLEDVFVALTGQEFESSV